MKFGFQTPFPVRVPCPIRWKGGEMEPESLQFINNEVRIAYPKHPTKASGWWFAKQVHQLAWLPNVRSSDDVIKHYWSFLREEHGPSRQKKKEQLRREAEFVNCGQGLACFCDPMLAGLKVIGGSNHIYLISKDGADGSLMVPTNIYQSYEISEFEIGKPSEWTDLPFLTEEPVAWSS